MSHSVYLLYWALGNPDEHVPLTSLILWLHHTAVQLRLLKLCLSDVRLFRLRCSVLLLPEGSLGSAVRFHVFCWQPAWKCKVCWLLAAM